MATSDPNRIRIHVSNYTYLGKDKEGGHHHADKKNARIIVCDDPGTRVGENNGYVELTGEIDHTETDLRYADDLERWADYVAVKRGWNNRALKTYPELRDAFADTVSNGGAA